MAGETLTDSRNESDISQPNQIGHHKMSNIPSNSSKKSKTLLRLRIPKGNKVDMIARAQTFDVGSSREESIFDLEAEEQSSVTWKFGGYFAKYFQKKKEKGKVEKSSKSEPESKVKMKRKGYTYATLPNGQPLLLEFEKEEKEKE